MRLFSLYCCWITMKLLFFITVIFVQFYSVYTDWKSKHLIEKSIDLSVINVFIILFLIYKKLVFIWIVYLLIVINFFLRINEKRN